MAQKLGITGFSVYFLATVLFSKLPEKRGIMLLLITVTQITTAKKLLNINLQDINYLLLHLPISLVRLISMATKTSPIWTSSTRMRRHIVVILCVLFLQNKNKHILNKLWRRMWLLALFQKRGSFHPLTMIAYVSLLVLSFYKILYKHFLGHFKEIRSLTGVGMHAIL